MWFLGCIIPLQYITYLDFELILLLNALDAHESPLSNKRAPLAILSSPFSSRRCDLCFALWAAQSPPYTAEWRVVTLGKFLSWIRQGIFFLFLWKKNKRALFPRLPANWCTRMVFLVFFFSASVSHQDRFHNMSLVESWQEIEINIAAYLDQYVCDRYKSSIFMMLRATLANPLIFVMNNAGGSDNMWPPINQPHNVFPHSWFQIKDFFFKQRNLKLILLKHYFTMCLFVS